LKQTGILFLYFGEFVFVVDDDESERVWRDEQSAIADLAQEGWKIARGPARIEPDLPGIEERNLVGYLMERTTQ
jgi:hypothetical protein